MSNAKLTILWFPGVILAGFCPHQMASPAFIIIGNRHLAQGTPPLGF